MKITAKWLAEREACEAGAAWFAERFPQGGEAEAVGAALIAEEPWHWMRWLAVKIAATDPKRAEELAGKIKDACVRDWTLCGVAGKAAEKNPQDAKRIATKIADAGWRAEALSDVAWKVAETDPEAAKEIAAGIEKAGVRDWALRVIAEKVAATYPAAAV